MIRSGAVNVNFQSNSANRTRLFISRDLTRYTSAVVTVSVSHFLAFSYEKFPRVYTRTRRYCSFVNHTLNNYQDKITNP